MATFGDLTTIDTQVTKAVSQLGFGLGPSGGDTSFSTALSGFALGTGTNVSSPATTRDVGSSERLNIIRPRSADHNQSGPDGRGQFAYIKLLTNPALKAAYSSGDVSKREIHDSNSKELFSNAAGMVSGVGYNKFLLTGISGVFNEKVQVKEVFGDNEVAYFFGKSPVYLNLTGVLMDSPDNQWFTSWIRMYSEFFRGTQLAKNYELLKLVLPNMTAVGTVTGMSWNQDASSDVSISFSFQFLVKSLVPTVVTNPDMIRSPGIRQIDFSKVAGFLDKAGINVLKSQTGIAQLTAILQDPTASFGSKVAAITSLGDGVQGIQRTLDSATSRVQGAVNDIVHAPLFQGVNAALTGIRSSFFSPVYGVLSSLTKLITTVFSGARKIFSAFTTPVLNILRDITDITSQANAIVGQVNRSTSGLGRFATSQLTQISGDYRAAINSIGRSSGALASKPTTSLQSAAVLHGSGFIPGSAPFLRSNTRASFSKPALGLGHAQPSKSAILIASTPTIKTSPASLKV